MKRQGRRSIRLKRYDYSSAGYYFVTMCSKNKQDIFSDIVVGVDVSVYPGFAVDEYEIKLTEIGEIVEHYLLEINNYYSNVHLDQYCIMPNHVHAIIVINDEAKEGGQGRPPLPKIIQGIKSMAARNCYKFGFRTIWQRNYYEHIIRNERSYEKVSRYIQANPAKWYAGEDRDVPPYEEKEE